MKIDGNNLYPDDGYKYITNGKVYSTWVTLGRFDSIDNWYDTNDEPLEIKSEEYEQGYDDGYNQRNLDINEV